MNPIKKKPDFIADKVDSTYRWEIYLTNGKILDGYSKSQNRAENQDKEALLLGCLTRLLNNGYLDKSFQLLFYRREFLHRSQDTPILQLNDEDFEPFDILKLQLPITEFLERVYKARKLKKSGLDYKEFLPKPKPFRHTEENDFLHSKTRFPTFESLINHCKYLLEEKKYPRQSVENFYRKLRWNYTEYTDSVGQQPAPTAAPQAPVRRASEVSPPVTSEAHAHYVSKAEKESRNTMAALQTRFKVN